MTLKDIKVVIDLSSRFTGGRISRAVKLGGGVARIAVRHPNGTVENFTVAPEMTPQEFDVYLNQFSWSVH